MRRKYLFADESGNFDFVRKTGASEYFAVGTVLVPDPDELMRIEAGMAALRHDLIWRGHPLYQGFHATTDSQDVRDAVFAATQAYRFHLDVTILEKCKAQPHLTADKVLFYQHAWFYHFRHVAQRNLSMGDELVVVAASLGTKKDRQAFRRAVEAVITQCCPTGVNFRVVSMRDDALAGLQLADYYLWAIMRDVEQGDPRSRHWAEVKKKSEFQLFASGTTRYY